MAYLVDANVLSEPTRPTPVARVVVWLANHERDLFVDPIILGELNVGVLSLTRGKKRTSLEHWLTSLSQTVECLPWDGAVSRRWAELVVKLKKRGEPMPILDSMIAATAIEHHLTLVTRNERDFARAGVSIFNPFA